MKFSRRNFLELAGYSAGISALSLGHLSPAYAACSGTTGHSLVVVYLRGGADWTFMVSPRKAALTADGGSPEMAFYMDIDSSTNTVNSLGRQHLYEWTVATNEPQFKDPTTSPTNGLAITGAASSERLHYHFHPKMTQLQTLFNNNEMSVVLGVGGVNNRSHFLAQDAMERARPFDTNQGTNNGWLFDFLQSHYGDDGSCTPIIDTPIGIAVSSGLSESLRGPSGQLTAAIPDAKDFGLKIFENYGTSGKSADDYEAFLNELYVRTANGLDSRNCEQGVDHDSYRVSRDSGNLSQKALDTLALGDAYDDQAPGVPLDFAGLTDGTAFERRLKDALRLVHSRSSTNVNVVNVDMGGWDSHDFQLLEQTANIEDLDFGIGEFVKALKNNSDFASTTVMIMTEFGRTTDFNGNEGTDHGDGCAMFVIDGGGSNFNGGRLINSGETSVSVDLAESYKAGSTNPRLLWPTFNTAELNRWKAEGAEENQRFYVPILTDYRSIFAEVLERRMSASAADLDAVFYSGTPVTVTDLKNGFDDPITGDERTGYAGLFA